MQKNIRNIGILAHVDAGKTTITEQFLYLVSATRTLGNVDKGTAITDFLEVEKQRGISVRSAPVSFVWENTTINLIDTPGHVDFSAEVERVLRVLDGAILVISAIEGVQAHTYTLWYALQNLKIPTIIFINKIDRPGADVFKVVDELNKELKANAIPVQFADNEEDINIEDLWLENSPKPEIKYLQEKYIEQLAEQDDELLDDYLNGIVIDKNRIKKLIQKQSLKAKMLPVLMGAAKMKLGVKELLEAIKLYIPSAKTDNSELSALVFKIEHNKKLGRLAHVRLFAGQLKNRDVVHNYSLDIDEKIARIQKVFTNKKEDVGELFAGDIGIISGMLQVRVGDILGKPEGIPKSTTLNLPLLTVQAKAINEQNYAQLAAALQELAGEDPTLDFVWLKAEKELHLKIMGAIQTEILQTILKNRFSIDAEFTEPTVVYKETPSKTGEGFVRYWMPKPCWAILKFKIEPGERGSGVIYKSEVSVNDIQKKYQNEVEKTIHKALEQGIKGWEVTDIKITLIEGEDHVAHSNPGDFIIATPMGIMRALENTGTTLLEPMLRFTISAAETDLGKITGDLTNMRAEFANPQFENERFTLSGIVPVATSLDYAIKLSALTSGKGKINYQFGEYRSCTDELGQTREYKGVNPLDESKWILHARGAYKADEWKL
jgi:ribosomal protection tetracycline resistance protein